MRCSACGFTDSRVLESRSAESGRSVRRRRECLNCRNRFTTYERIEFVPLTVIKRNGDRESFDSTKLLRGIVTACEKTEVTAIEQERIVNDIEADLQQDSRREIASSELGELVLQALKPLSEVAYVRFASVYRQFQSIRDFVEALDRLRGGEGQTIESLDANHQGQSRLAEADETIAENAIAENAISENAISENIAVMAIATKPTQTSTRSPSQQPAPASTPS